MQNAAHGSKTHENWVSVCKKLLKSLFYNLVVSARDLSLGLFILGSGVRLWAVGPAAAAVTVHPRRDGGLSNHNQGKNPYSKQLFGE